MRELEIIEHRLIDGFSIFLNTLDYRTPHIHPEWELIWVLEDPLSVTCGPTEFLVQPGQMVLFSPNEPHEFRKTAESSTFLCLQISPSLLPIAAGRVMDGKLPHEHLPGDTLQQLRQTLASVMVSYLSRDENRALYCVGQCQLVMHQLFSRLPYHELAAEEEAAIARKNARLNRLIRYVDENYMDKIRLSDFARQEGCSVTHLSHFIKNTMNQTFQEYVGAVRFNRACQLMADGNRKMLDICMESGFSDYRYFSRAFRRRFDMTPEEYSRCAGKNQLESAVVHRSIHSMERFYSREESLALLKKYI